MCGISGFNWSDKQLINKMNDLQKHRGPDGSGVYLDDGISLGHTRLSIIDLSSRGKQPMGNENGTIWITFNGEIYNFKELRSELETKHDFKSDTDTEVIIHAYEEWGLKCIERFNGMFSFAIYDSEKRVILLARDRLGIKPLYYYFDGYKFIFASETKTILATGCDISLDPSFISDIFTYRVIPGDKTPFSQIKKVLPGEMVVFNLQNLKLSNSKYWDIQLNGYSADYDTIKNSLDATLCASVKRMLVADVPLTVSLSGGLDSSLITAMAFRHKKDLKSYTVGFNMQGDENPIARKVAEHVGIEQEDIFVSLSGIENEIEKIIFALDEPAADPAIIPSYFLYKKIREKATVVLLGEGSDEIFAGYLEYKLFSPYLPAPKFIKRKLFSNLRAPFKDRAVDFTCRDLNDVLLQDVRNILPNFQLLRVDKLTMAVSLEARVPYLDHEIVEQAFKIPPGYKLKGLTEKWILKEVAKRYLPQDIVKRRKKTFFTPLDAWMDIMTAGSEEFIREKILKEHLDYPYFEKLIKDIETKGFKEKYQLFIFYLIEKWLRVTSKNLDINLV